MEGGEHLYRLTEELALTKTRGFKTALASLDVEKAFDSVWHDGIRHKFSASGTQLPAKIIRLSPATSLDEESKPKQEKLYPEQYIFEPELHRAAFSRRRSSTSM